MPDTPTTRLGLYKSASDGSEDVDYTQDIGQNLDKLDAAAGFQPVTSSTRPGSPYSGKPIMETDTSYRTYVSNGTAPASASWVEIPNSSAIFNNNLKLAVGKQLNIGASTSTAPVAIFTTSTSSNIISSRITGDTANSRWFVNADGGMNWGPGGGSGTDVNLYRSGVNVLATDDSLVVGGSLTVAGVGQVLTAYKTGDTSRASTTTTSPDPHLQVSVAANAVYQVEMFIAYTSLDTVDIQFDYSAPASATGILSPWAPDQSLAASGTTGTVRYVADASVTAARAVGGSDASTIVTGRPVGTLITSGTAGTFSFDWAQNLSNATATVVKAGSWIRLTRMA